MNYELVPAVSIAAMIISLIVAIALPICLFIYFRVKHKADISAFFIGCATFIVFALILEQILHLIVTKALGMEILENMWFYAIYGGIAAAVFEETGRFVAMKYVMKNKLSAKNALMYGAGHGGIEALLILGIAEISNIASSAAINAGLLDTLLAPLDGAVKQQTYEQLSLLWTTSPAEFMLGGVERIIAVAAHIGMSFFVFMGIKYSKNGIIACAYISHFLLDAVSVLIIRTTDSIAITEVIVAVIAVLICILARHFWMNLKDTNTEITEQPSDVN